MSNIETSPYVSFPQTDILNSILLQVKVPVLSENTYYTYPNSSLIVVLKTLTYLSFSAVYISLSFYMKIPYPTFTNSKDTIKLIGIKVFKSKKYAAKVINEAKAQFGTSGS